ncbi:cell wall-associated NlpC family hydrolase [Hamadaea flava]|uniref:NlpC/P60 family protein n=1 Tax=Hamadaea flava TaxID=1742688 RepID=A0ABV8LK02_9ACTN|nr:C40 family peptidase [Hamadaea flava]MCP2325038.1 cell wall-associated NlpC family hydrolase [Hamadaea flava]
MPLVAALAVLLAPGAAHAAPSESELSKQITEASTKLEKLVEQFNKSTEQAKSVQAQIQQLETSLGPLAHQRDDARQRVAKLAASAYAGSGQLATWNALLGTSSPTDVVERLGTLQQLADTQTTMIESARDAGDKYDEQKSALQTALAKAQEDVAKLAAQKKQIEGDLKKLEAQKKQLYGTSSQTSGRYTGKIPAVSGKAGVAVTYAYNAIGKPYAWGADGPSSYDCSGLTMAAWKAAGVSLYHHAATQYDETARISRSQLAPGDLVFYSDLGHVAIYVGSGKVIHAPTFGESVKLASIDMMTPYGYGRVKS